MPNYLSCETVPFINLLKSIPFKWYCRVFRIIFGIECKNFSLHLWGRRCNLTHTSLLFFQRKRNIFKLKWKHEIFSLNSYIFAFLTFNRTVAPYTQLAWYVIGNLIAISTLDCLGIGHQHSKILGEIGQQNCGLFRVIGHQHCWERLVHQNSGLSGSLAVITVNH